MREEAQAIISMASCGRGDETQYETIGQVIRTLMLAFQL